MTTHEVEVLTMVASGSASSAAIVCLSNRVA